MYVQGERPLDLGLEEKVDLNLCEHKLPYEHKFFVLLQQFSLEEIVSKSTLLCGDRTQENA